MWKLPLTIKICQKFTDPSFRPLHVPSPSRVGWAKDKTFLRSAYLWMKFKVGISKGNFCAST